MPEDICHLCHRVWTGTETSGVCYWCGKLSHKASAERTRPRAEPQRRHKPQPEPRGIGEGYEGLPIQEGWLANGEGFRWVSVNWGTLFDIARRFAHKAKSFDKDDLLDDIIEGLARVAQRKAAKGEEFSEPAMVRTAEHIKDVYWYRHYAYNNGLDCRNCTTEQRAKCRWNWAHSEWAYCDCHRAIQLESINQPITDADGNLTELGDLIADDKALDLEAWVDAKTFLIGAPIRLKAIARKRVKGETLNHAELCYLSRLRRKSQKALV